MSSTAEPPELPSLLVLDDDPNMLKMLRQVLEPHYLVEAAESPDQAEFALVNGDHHVLLCDEKLPGESGIAFMTRLKKKHPFLVKIISSGYVDKTLLSKAMNEASVSYVLEKPFDMYVLFKTVRKAVDDSLRLRKTAAIEAALRHHRTHSSISRWLEPFQSGWGNRSSSLRAVAILLFAAALGGALLALGSLYFLKASLGVLLF